MPDAVAVNGMKLQLQPPPALRLSLAESRLSLKRKPPLVLAYPTIRQSELPLVSCIVLKSKWRGKRVWRGSSSCCLLLGWVGYLGAASCCVVGRIKHPASYFRTE